MRDPVDFEALLRTEGAREAVRTFTASYESDCATCGDRILEGDPAGYIGSDDQASCGDCLP